MEYSNTQDLKTGNSTLVIILSEGELSLLPSWLIRPLDSDIVVQLRYLVEVAKYLQTLEESNMGILSDDDNPDYNDSGDRRDEEDFDAEDEIVDEEEGEIIESVEREEDEDAELEDDADEVIPDDDEDED